MPRTKKEASVKEAITKKKTAAKSAPSRKKPARSFNFQTYYQGIVGNIQKNRKQYGRYLIILVIVIAIGVFAFIKKDWFVVATVNNQPITSVEYYQNLKAKDGSQVLNQIIQDRLINQEANKKGVTVSEADINKKVATIQKQVGGADQLKNALSSRNLSESEFRNQIKIQLLVEKLLQNEIKVSDKEVDDYIAKNQNSTDPNTTGVDLKNRDAVKTQLQSDKLNQKFQSWYSNLQKQASINKFI